VWAKELNNYHRHAQRSLILFSHLSLSKLSRDFSESEVECLREISQNIEEKRAITFNNIATKMAPKIIMMINNPTPSGS
jgi:hypothetical protein